MAVRTPMTAEELLRYGPDDKDVELIRGRMIVREPPGMPHGRCAATLCMIVGHYVHTHRLGAVYAQDTGFQIEEDPDTVLAPDLAFIRRERFPLDETRPYGFGAPDLVAEILSPSDRRRRVAWKIQTWLAKGVQLAWVIDAKRRTATMYLSDGTTLDIAADGPLTGADVLPGFSCALADVFDV